MSTPYFFSHDEDGFNFFGSVFELIRETPRLEDCYVYVGEAELLGPESDQVEYEEWQEYREDSMNALDWIQYEGKYQHNLLTKENEELKEKIICLESDSHNEISMAEYDELKKEKEQLEHDLLCHHCEIRWHDPKGNNDRPDKEYIDEYCEEFGYDDETKETLYEAFCIDEDEDEDEDEE